MGSNFGRKFGAAFMQNLGGLGMQHYAQQQEDKRAYERLKNQNMLEMLGQYGTQALTPAMMQELEKTMPGSTTMYGPEWKGSKAMESAMGVDQAGKEAYAREVGTGAAKSLGLSGAEEKASAIVEKLDLLRQSPIYLRASKAEQEQMELDQIRGIKPVDPYTQQMNRNILGLREDVLQSQVANQPIESRLKELEEQKKKIDMQLAEIEKEKKNIDVTQAKAEAAKIKKPEEAFSLISDSIENVYANWSTIPKEKRGRWTNAWYKQMEKMGAETLPDDPNYGNYYVSKTGLAVDLATQWEPKKGGGVQMLTQPDIERYTSMIPTLATTDDATGWQKKEQLKKILSKKMGVDYQMKPYPGGTTSDINKEKARLDQLERKAAERGLIQ